MAQPTYDFEFAKLVAWLKENNLIARTDIRGRTIFVKKEKRPWFKLPSPAEKK